VIPCLKKTKQKEKERKKKRYAEMDPGTEKGH
jgi:hypothetical protein